MGVVMEIETLAQIKKDANAQRAQIKKNASDSRSSFFRLPELHSAGRSITSGFLLLLRDAGRCNAVPTSGLPPPWPLNAAL
jgi:hypothetical protein